MNYLSRFYATIPSVDGDGIFGDQTLNAVLALQRTFGLTEDGIVGYAYYSDLYELDIISGLEGTYVWVIKDTYGLTPGYYRMVESDDPDSELYYGYDLIAPLEEWPGLPNGEILPD